MNKTSMSAKHFEIEMIVLFVFILLFSLTKGKTPMESFIVGGQHAKSIQEFPHVAVLLDKYMRFYCGSSVLNQLILITAAHCLTSFQKTSAFVGHLHKFKGKQYIISETVVHGNWHERSFEYDIGMCKLKTPLELGVVKRVIVMRRPPNVNIAVVSGWGTHNDEHTLRTPNEDRYLLKYTEQVLWSPKDCKDKLPHFVEGAICAYSGQNTTSNSISFGDSGGGLIIRSDILIGVTSHMLPGVPRIAVYSNVSYFYDWIELNAKTLACM